MKSPTCAFIGKPVSAPAIISGPIADGAKLFHDKSYEFCRKQRTGSDLRWRPNDAGTNGDANLQWGTEYALVQQQHYPAAAL
jgi:hypothetical protein